MIHWDFSRRPLGRTTFAAIAFAFSLFLIGLIPAPTHAKFGAVPGSVIGKAHPTVPLVHLPGGASSPPATERFADTDGIKAAPFLSQAGSHPDATGAGELADASFHIRNFFLETPPGFIGNPNAVVACDREAFRNSIAEGDPREGCTPASQVGVASVALASGLPPDQTNPVYRITPSPGAPASFGFSAGGFGIVINGNVRTDGDYGLTIAATDISNNQVLERTVVTIWGVPADPIHDPDRWDPNKDTGRFDGGSPIIGDWGASSGLPRIPFIQTPTDCSADHLISTARISSWQEPGIFLPEDPFDPTYAIPAPQPTGCEKLVFSPWIALHPSVARSDSPTGVSVEMEVPQNYDADGFSTPQVKKAVVTLPEGMSVNPAAADGLQACSPAQIGLLGTSFAMPSPIRFAKGDAACPEASKIGTGEIETALLEEKLKGDVYLATPFENPFKSLLAMYLVFRGPGFVVKLPGKVEIGPGGQLTTTFDNGPQLPFDKLTLDLFGGPRAPLATPQTCGEKRIETTLTPWSTPFTPDATPSNRYTANEGPGGTACSYTLASRPFSPELVAGSRNPVGGRTSAFDLRLRRVDGNQELAGLTVKTPPGLAAYLKDIPYCSDEAIEVARTRTGTEAAARSDCPSASRVGGVLAGAGVGPTPFFAKGEAFLAGPYKGAPLSLATITPALAGGTPGNPVFDLGTVVIRVALQVHSETARITAVSDPIPQTLEGIPLRIKDVRVLLDRPGWIINPTSCAPKSVDADAAGASGGFASLSSRFQLANCGALDFGPRFYPRLSGSTKRLGHPRLRAVLAYADGAANLRRVSVALPSSELLDQSRIKTVCTRVQFAADRCPQESIYGYAKAFTPLLDRPLEGPVYLRSSNNLLPDLVAALHGQVDVDVVGRIDSINGGIRTTFESVPDAPVSKFILTMQGGKKGLLVNTRSLCSAPSRVTAKFDAQNGKTHDTKPLLQNSCDKRAYERRR